MLSLYTWLTIRWDTMSQDKQTGNGVAEEVSELKHDLA